MVKTTEVVKKITMIGTGGVGKTSLIKRFILNIFDDKYLRTLGTKISQKVIEIEYPEKYLRIQLTMLIWDIVGQDSFRPLLQDAYFYGVNGSLAVCDATRADTLRVLDEWVESLHKISGDVPMIILANKCDLKDSMEIGEETLKSYAEKYNAPFLYTSAKNGENVEDAFLQLGRMTTSEIG
ncbi:MAG: GTP-binding protein [Thermoplasmata archaeon]|nr:MAG: GTP-binding protein [Thermoplasmata archaeon]